MSMIVWDQDFRKKSLMFQGGSRSHPPTTHIPPEIREGGSKDRSIGRRHWLAIHNIFYRELHILKTFLCQSGWHRCCSSGRRSISRTYWQFASSLKYSDYHLKKKLFKDKGGQVGWCQRINNVARMKIDPQEGSPVGKVQYLEIKIAKKRFSMLRWEICHKFYYW